MSTKNPAGFKKQVLSIGLILLLAVLTLFLLSRQTNGLDSQHLLHFFKTLHPGYLILCLGSMLCMVFAEGYSLKRFAAKLGRNVSLGKATMWAASDYYFSGLTPCATGGQPVAVYFMYKDGFSLSHASAALVVNTMMYTLSLLAWGLICLVSCWKQLFQIPFTAKGFLLYGSITHILLIVICLLCMFRQNWMRHIGNWGIDLFAKIHLIKQPQQRKEALAASLADYAEAVAIIRRNPFLLVEVLGANMVQRFATALPVCLLYLGIGGSISSIWTVYSLNVLCLLSSAAVPIPGTVGISELMFLQYLEGYFGGLAVPAMLTNRTIVFYFCLLLCGLWTLSRMFILQRRKSTRPTV